MVGTSISRKDTGLVTAQGVPIIREVMEDRIASATLMGVRQAVGEVVSAGLDPVSLATLLIEAQEGDPLAYMQLAEEIEEKDLQYLAVLGQRKRQVSQLDITLEGGSDSRVDKGIVGDAQEVFIDSGLLEGVIFDMLDAIGKGFSLTEIVWNLDGNVWSIDSLDHVDPRFIRFDRPTRRIPLLRADNDMGIGIPLPPYKFAWLHLKAKSGLPVRSGFARPVCWAWMFKNFALKDWVQFCEIYGMPFRYGTFTPGASQADKDALLQAVTAISSDAAAIIPSNMEIVFAETGIKGSTGDVHGALTAYLDAQISKAVIGQTGTVDATPGKLGAQQDHTMVREDIERADARALMTTINRDIIRPWVNLNYGPQDKYPWIWIGRPEPSNVLVMVDTAAKLIPLGLKVRTADIRSAVGFNEPEAGDELLTPPPAVPGAPPLSTSIISPRDLNYNLNARMQLLAAEMMTSTANERASARSTISSSPDAIERATADAVGGWQEVMGGAVDQILAAASRSKTFDDFMVNVRSIAPTLDMTPLARKLASLTFQAYAGGATGHEIETRPARDLASADTPYGDVEYADPGYQSDKKKRYPIDTEEHIRAAWSYINQARNHSQYSASEVDHIKSRIVGAWKKKIDPAGPPSAHHG